MNYAQLRKMDVANGEGIRVSLFVSGCTHNCKGCFNKEYQDFSYGKPMDFSVTDEIIKLISTKIYRGLTLIGGEPFQNTELIKYVVPIREYIDIYNEQNNGISKKDIWIYSGYTFEQICEDKEMKRLLELTDVLVDGLFVEQLLDLRLKFRGSSNQRVIDVKKSLLKGEVVYYFGDKSI